MRFWNLFCLTVAVLVTASTPAFSQDSQEKPNIIILFADDLGYGDLGCYGSPMIATPVLDKMAREGVQLTEFYAAPSCSPARALLMTGRYPHRTGVTHVYGPDSDKGLPASEITLAEALREQGYRTAMFGKWHLGSADPIHRPMACGFDEYFGTAIQQ